MVVSGFRSFHVFSNYTLAYKKNKVQHMPFYMDCSMLCIKNSNEECFHQVKLMHARDILSMT